MLLHNIGHSLRRAEQISHLVWAEVTEALDGTQGAH